MPEISSFVLGGLLFILGLGWIGAVQAVWQLFSKKIGHSEIQENTINIEQRIDHDDGVLYIEYGGKLRYLNQSARELFGVVQENLDLESLIRRARPAEEFLKLCSGEGQASFWLNGSFVEGSSYFIPNIHSKGSHLNPGTLIVLRRTQAMIKDVIIENGDHQHSEIQPAGRCPSQALKMIAELSQMMGANPDFFATVRAIFEGIERVQPADYLEITLLNAEKGVLIPFRLVGLPGKDRRLEQYKGRNTNSSTYSGRLISTGKPLLVCNVEAFNGAQPDPDQSEFPYKSYLGIPLLVGCEIVGTIELASLEKEYFSEKDLETLQLFSGQAAIALRNSKLYDEEQARASELSGLVGITQAGEFVQDPQNLFQRLVESIASLFQVEFLGFLIYDEERRLLRGQPPFLGILDSVVEWYQATIEPGSKAEEVLYSTQPIVTEDATEDARLQVLGFHHLAQASGIRYAVLIPLLSRDRPLGFLMAARKRDSLVFGPEELRLIEVAANQALPIIENAGLLEVARSRARRAESLRRIASLTRSSADLDEILKFSLQDVARLLDADAAAIFLLDESKGALEIHVNSAFGIVPDINIKSMQISIHSEDFLKTATCTQKPFLIENLSDEIEPSRNYWPWLDKMGFTSVSCSPLITNEGSIGELVVTSFKPDCFHRLDLQILSSAADLIASAINQVKSSRLTDETLQWQVERLTAMNRLNRDLRRTLDLRQMLETALASAIKMTGADCGAIRLFQIEPSEMSLHHEQIETAMMAHRVMVYVGDDLGRSLSPIERAIILSGKSRIINEENILSENQLGLPTHAGIRSALLIPINAKERVFGLIHLHSLEPDHFGNHEREIAAALADQTSYALENAVQFEECVQPLIGLRNKVEVLMDLLIGSHPIQAECSLDANLRKIVEVIRNSIQFNDVRIIYIDQSSDSITPEAKTVGCTDEKPSFPGQDHTWAEIQSLLKPEFAVGRFYLIPDQGSTEIYTMNLQEESAENVDEEGGGGRVCKPDDLLIAPLIGSKGDPLGWIWLGSPFGDLRLTNTLFEMLGVLSHHTSLIIENHLKVVDLTTKLREQTTKLESAQDLSNQAMQQLAEIERQNQLNIQKIHARDESAHRVFGGLELANLISIQNSREDLFALLGQEILRRMNFDQILIAAPVSGGVSLVAKFGETPSDQNMYALLGQKNPIRYCLLNTENLLISDLDECDDWMDSPLLQTLKARRFLCLAIPTAGREGGLEGKDIGSRAQLALLAAGRSKGEPFTPEDEKMLQVLAWQVAGALYHIKIMEQTHRRMREVNQLLEFSQKLGSLDPAIILRTLVESSMEAVPGAQYAMAAMWNPVLGRLLPQIALGYTDIDELRKVEYLPGEGIPGQVFDNCRSVNLQNIDFLVHYNLSSDNLLHYRNATGGSLPVSSLAVPIIVGTAGTENASEALNALQTMSGSDKSFPLGVLTLDSTQLTDAFSDDDLAILTSFAQQTALSLQNARLYEETRSLTAGLEKRVYQRTAELEREHMRSETLLRIITELSASLDLKQVLDQTLKVISEYVEAEHLAILIDRPGQTELQTLASNGREKVRVSDGIGPSHELEQALGRWVLDQRQPILIGRLSEDERWRITEPMSDGNSFESAMAIPLMSGAEALGCLILLHEKPGFFSIEQLDLVQAAANQVSISVNNAELFRLIRDQAEDLGTMLRNQQVETSQTRAILEAVADGVVVTDPNRIITLFNNSAENILGMECIQAHGKPIGRLAGRFGQAMDQWLETIDKWSENPDHLKVEDIFLEQVVLENSRVVSIHMAPVSFHSDFLGTVSIFQDVTHQKEIDRLKSEFVSTVSHELRTPMTSIKGYVEILLMGAAGELSGQQKHFLNIVKSNTERLAVLVNDLLDISQIESGRLHLSLQPTDLGEIAERAILDLKKRMNGDGRKISIEKLIQPGLPLVMADAERLSRVLDNLLDNAYLYNLAEGRIQLAVKQEDTSLRVDVKDTGLGISPVDAEHVFERFFRGENPLVLGVAGTGLGLSIVKKLIDMHGGKIWVESLGIPGNGSTFSFSLPVCPSEALMTRK